MSTRPAGKGALRVAVIGCSKVADLHVEQITRAPGCKIVAVCDQEELMARQLQERLGSPERFVEVEDLLDKCKPDVVHITTPLETHYSIAKLCLEAGCHVYVEKPFTVTVDEARELLVLAERRNLKLTVGHGAQFSHAANRMRQLVDGGFLGGPPVHLECYCCYDLSDADYTKAMLGNSQGGAGKFPGGLLRKTVSHGISKIAEFLPGDTPEVAVQSFTSDLLKNAGATEIADELRVTIRDGAVTAYFTVSQRMRPPLRLLRLYGPKNGLSVDETQQSVIKLRGRHYPSYLEQFLPPLTFAKQYVGNAVGNMKKFARADFQAGYGTKFLTREFYRSIREGGSVPIPYSEILRTSRLMDEIFSQIRTNSNSVAARLGETGFVEHLS